MIRRLFRIKWQQDQGINTIPNSTARYLWCCIIGHDMEPYDYDEMEPCKRCGIEDDRNCLKPLVYIRVHVLTGGFFKHLHYMMGRKE